MKNLFVLFLTLSSSITFVNSQCDPSTTVTNPYQPVGFIPLPTGGKLEPSQFFCYPGQSFDKVLTALAPQSLVITNPIGIPPTIPVDINWIRVTDIQNLPSWVTYSCGGQLDPTDPCKMAFPTWSCVRAFANTPDGKVPLTEIPGTVYSLDVIVDADVNPLGTQSNYNGGSISLLVLDTMSMNLAFDACNGGQIASNAQGGFGDPTAYEYTWSNGEFTPNITGLATGWYTCTVSDVITGFQATDSIYVDAVLTPIVISNEVVTQPTNNNGSISISASGGTGTLNFSWTGPNGFSSTSQSISNLAGGQYIVTITDANNCSIQKTYNLSTASIEEFTSAELIIFPNPTTNFVIIKNANSAQSLKVDVISNDGKLLQQNKLVSVNSEYNLPLNQLNAGKYLLKIYTGEKVIYRSVIVN
jgi:hypothetical protein